MPKVSSPARRPRAFNWRSPPWSARGRRTERVSALAQREQGEREGGGALAGSGSGHRRGARAPQARAARQSAAHRQQIRWGSPAGREADPSVPRGPSRPRKEVTGALRTPAGRLGRAGAACGRRRLEVAAAPGGWRREAAERATGALGAGRRLCGQGQEAGAECCQLAQLAAPVAAQNRGLAGRRPPPPPQAPEGALRAESHSQAEALGAPSLTGARAPPPPRCSLGWSVSFTGNSRRRQPPPRQRVGRRAGGRLSTSCTAHPPQELGSAQVEPRWGPGFLGAEERRAPGSSSPPSRPLLPDTTPSLPPVTPLPLLGLLSLPISLLYAILRDWGLDEKFSEAEQRNCSSGRLGPIPPPRENTTAGRLKDPGCTMKGLEQSSWVKAIHPLSVSWSTQNSLFRKAGMWTLDKGTMAS